MSEPKQQLGYDNIVKALKVHAATTLGGSEAELEAGFSAFQNETDRGAVILGATRLEDSVADRLALDMAHLNSDERSRLFGYDGPLGTFSAKLRLAYALKHFDRQTFKMAELIREMRNACAHSRQAISFEDEALRNAVLQLGSMVDFDITSGNNRDALRFSFLTVIAWLANYIYEDREKRSSFKAFLVRIITEFKQQQASAETPPEQSSPENPENQKGA